MNTDNNEPMGKVLAILSICFAWISNESAQEIISIMSGFVAITSGSCATVYYIIKTKRAIESKKDEE